MNYFRIPQSLFVSFSAVLLLDCRISSNRLAVWRNVFNFAFMNQLRRVLVWLGRIHRCRGFGIQSPTDYCFVRYVINEHWPYYAYDSFNDSDWLTNKLGRLYFRLANWRQPRLMQPNTWESYVKAGCKHVRFDDIVDVVEMEMAFVSITDFSGFECLLHWCGQHSVLVVEDLWRDRKRWHDIEHDSRVGTTYDLYYCGIVFFDKVQFKRNYKINF